MRSVLFVTRETLADRRYGLGKSVMPVFAALERRGWRARYVCQEDLGERARARIGNVIEEWKRRMPGRLGDTDMHVLAPMFAERLAMGRLAARIAAAEGFSRVHCHDPIIGLGYWLFGVAGSGLGARWGVSEHGFGCYMQAFQDEGYLFGRKTTRRLRALEAFVLRRCDWVLVPTAAGVAALGRDLGASPPPGHWHVVPHPRPELRRYPKDEARAQLGWDRDAFYVLSVGRIVGLKQFPEVMRAVAQLAVSRRMRVVVLGDGDREALLGEARAAGLGEPPIVATTDDVGLYLSAADLYVSLSRTESFGMANLEAMIAGMPSICSAVGGVPDVTGAGALLIPPTVEALTEALRSVVDDEAELAKMGERARRRACGWPDADAIAELYERAYA